MQLIDYVQAYNRDVEQAVAIGIAEFIKLNNEAPNVVLVNPGDIGSLNGSTGTMRVVRNELSRESGNVIVGKLSHLP